MQEKLFAIGRACNGQREGLPVHNNGNMGDERTTDYRSCDIWVETLLVWCAMHLGALAHQKISDEASVRTVRRIDSISSKWLWSHMSGGAS